jgi:GntR family transcriptional regulator, transcriptional repressor for pyruvate dehydrogenase complex
MLGTNLHGRPRPILNLEKGLSMAAASRKHALIYETVLEYIKGALLEGKLKAGERLPTVNEMARELGVGPASVREAYRVLETMGILEVRQGRGTTVAADILEPSQRLQDFEAAQQQSIASVMEARQLIEPGVAALAAVRATPMERSAIMRAADEMERMFREGKDFVEPDLRLHDSIFAAAHNATLAQTLTGLHEIMVDLRRLATRNPLAVEKSVHYHKLIAIAIQEGNAGAAQSLMQQHLEDAERELKWSSEQAALIAHMGQAGPATGSEQVTDERVA